MKTKLKVNLFDLLLLLTIVLSTTGFLTAQTEKNSLNKIITRKQKIAVKVYVSDVPIRNNQLFQVGDEVFITIRNKPYTKLEIIKVEERPKLALSFDRTGTYKAIPDPTKLDFTDYLITISDTALKTKDGYVVEGNKIKIGNQLELESFNFRLNGKIIDILPFKE